MRNWGVKGAMWKISEFWDQNWQRNNLSKLATFDPISQLPHSAMNGSIHYYYYYQHLCLTLISTLIWWQKKGEQAAGISGSWRVQQQISPAGDSNWNFIFLPFLVHFLISFSFFVHFIFLQAVFQLLGEDYAHLHFPHHEVKLDCLKTFSVLGNFLSASIMFGKYFQQTNISFEVLSSPQI